MNQHTETPEHTCERVKVRDQSTATPGGRVRLTWFQCPVCEDERVRVTSNYAEQDTSHALLTDSAGAS